jgi:hypothetical protein
LVTEQSGDFDALRGKPARSAANAPVVRHILVVARHGFTL